GGATHSEIYYCAVQETEHLLDAPAAWRVLVLRETRPFLANCLPELDVPLPQQARISRVQQVQALSEPNLGPENGGLAYLRFRKVCLFDGPLVCPLWSVVPEINPQTS